MIGPHTARVAAQVTEAKTGPLAGRQQPRNPVCLLEAAVETDDAVAVLVGPDGVPSGTGGRRHRPLAETLGAAVRPLCHAQDRCCAARVTQRLTMITPGGLPALLAPLNCHTPL